MPEQHQNMEAIDSKRSHDSVLAFFRALKEQQQQQLFFSIPIAVVWSYVHIYFL